MKLVAYLLTCIALVLASAGCAPGGGETIKFRREDFIKSMLLFTRLVLVVVVLLSAAGGAFGQPYPTKPIQLIVPWAPGAGCDLAARLGSTHATNKWGVSVNVLNVTGASGVTGMLQALNARPDGYTLLMDGNVTSSFMFGSRTDLPLKIEDRGYVSMATAETG